MRLFLDLIIMFIGLVPLGAFFDTKQPPKPNMEHSFMKRQKRATNPSQCVDNCKLEFSKISNSYLTIVPSFNSTAIDISSVKNQLPSDIIVPNSGFEGFEYGFRYDDSSTKKTVQNFYKSNATKVVKGNVPGGSYYERYNIDKLVDVKITFSNQNYSQRWNIISFSAVVSH